MERQAGIRLPAAGPRRLRVSSFVLSLHRPVPGYISSWSPTTQQSFSPSVHYPPCSPPCRQQVQVRVTGQPTKMLLLTCTGFRAEISLKSWTSCERTTASTQSKYRRFEARVAPLPRANVTTTARDSTSGASSNGVWRRTSRPTK